jgi:hypothetical protein
VVIKSALHSLPLSRNWAENLILENRIDIEFVSIKQYHSLLSYWVPTRTNNGIAICADLIITRGDCADLKVPKVLDSWWI